MLYTVGEIAKKLHVAPSTLRYYDKEGLLPFVERSDSGIRLFKDSDMEGLRVIECLKKTGMPIKDIKVFMELCQLGDSTIDERLALIDKQRETVLEQQKQLQETLDTLNYKHWYYETAAQAGTCAVHDLLTAEDIPEDLRPAYQKLKKTED